MSDRVAKSTGRAAAPDLSAMAGPLVELVTAPKPVVIEETRGFWEGTVAGELRVQACGACGNRQLPGGPCCASCLSQELAWQPVSGRGNVFSFTVVHRALHPAFADKVPYVFADIQLEEGPILPSNVTGVAPERVHVGMPVEVWFEETDTDAFGSPYALPKFRPREG